MIPPAPRLAFPCLGSPERLGQRQGSVAGACPQAEAGSDAAPPFGEPEVISSITRAGDANLRGVLRQAATLMMHRRSA